MKTSGYAITSLVCGVIGLMTCCLFVPSILAVVFGVLALSEVRRGEAGGGPLAVSGIVLGVIAIVAGMAFVIVVELSDDATPICQQGVSATDRGILESMGVVEQDEEIVLLCTVSVKDDGIVLTAQRLVLYEESDIRACPLAQIRSIEYTPAEFILDDGQFVIEGDDGEWLIFSVSGLNDGDKTFHRVLDRLVAKLREDADKP